MFDGLKTSVAVLLGLVIGAIVAMPLAWHGTRLGADSLHHNIERALEQVESRQQEMADQALKLEELLVSKGDHEGADVFDQVMDARSKLAGVAPLEEKLASVQELEQALLLSEKVWEQSGQKARVRSSFYWAEHGREWEKQKRLLVKEQETLVNSVVELDKLLNRWPASVLLGYKSVGAMINAMLGDVVGNTAYVMRWTLDWVGYWARKAAALRGQQAPPEPPKWERPAGVKTVGYMEALVPPHFLADAPIPEDDYNEVQFTREGTNYADVELGEDKAVLENRHAPEGYKIVLPQPQKTVTYK